MLRILIKSSRTIARPLVGSFACALLFLTLTTAAQMPGMPDPEKKKDQVSTAAAQEASTVQLAASEQPELTGWGKYYTRYMGVDSPYRPLILTVVTLLVLVNLKRYLSKILGKQVNERAFSPENAKTFMTVWNRVWKFIIALLVIMAMSGSLKLLGLTAGFFGMMLGWSLQQPVTGIAAWLMIIFKKPFQIGDRVIIAGITGDVTAITLTHVILNQVGGSIGGEERSGRGILIPNAILFQNVIINYTLDQAYMLDEVPVRLTFDSDWERAKEILIAAATEVTADIIAETGAQPFVRAEFLDWGLLVRLRYNTIPTKRQELSTYIIEILLREFRKDYPRVRFAVPASNVRYKLDDRGQTGSFPPVEDAAQLEPQP